MMTFIASGLRTLALINPLDHVDEQLQHHREGLRPRLSLYEATDDMEGS